MSGSNSSEQLNWFSNETRLWNHPEPILSIPDPGECNLITGYEGRNFTSDVFLPCCANTSSIYYERTRCVCVSEGPCTSCLARHSEEFRLIAAVCNTKPSSAFPRIRVPKMAVALFVIGALVLQASASVMPLKPRDWHDFPGNYITELQDDRVLSGRSTTAISRAIEHFGDKAIIDCLGNAATNADHAAAASDALIQHIGGGLTLPPHTCRARDFENTIAEICNNGDIPYQVDVDQVEAAFDLMHQQCSPNVKSGKIIDGRIQYNLFARAILGRTGQKRSVSAAKCINPGDREVTGCVTDICKPKFKVNPSGDCPWTKQEKDSCGQYCEQRATKYYGQAEDFEHSSFCGGAECTIAEGVAYTYEKSISANFEPGSGINPIQDILGFGVSFGWTFGKQEMVTQEWTLRAGLCGYWMKVPVMLHSCGVYSEYKPNFGGEGPLECLEDASLDYTKKDSCSDTIAKTSSGKNADIIVIPRLHDCKNRKELPMDKQSKEWRDYYGGGLDDAKC